MRSLWIVAASLTLACAGGDGATGSAGATSATQTGATTTADTTAESTTQGTTGGAGETSGSSGAETTGDAAFAVGGAVEGLEGAGLRLLLNGGGEPLEIAGDGPFTFPAALADGEPYAVTVDLQPAPPDQTCSIGQGSGAIAGADVIDVAVRCRTPIRHVVVIGVDGLGGAYVSGIDTPNLDALAAEGVATLAMQNVLPTMSAPNWMSMIAGSTPDQHGVLSNSWSPGDSQPTPTIFAVARDHLPAAKIGVFHDWDAFDDLVEPGVTSHIESPGDEVETMAAALAWMAAERPALLFVHLDHVDHAGHFHGWGGDDYRDAVESADALIGEAVAALEAAQMRPYTALVISADHGGEGLSHGDDTSLERPIPFIVQAPQIAPATIDREVRIFDLAATVAALLGAEAPASWLGRPVVEALIDAAEPPTPDVRLELLEVTDYEWRYDDAGSGAFEDASIWRPLAPPGYVIVGDVAVVGHDPPDFPAIVVKDAPGALAPPLGFERIWDDEGSLGKNDVALWSPIAPLGYACLGTVAQQLYDVEPSPQTIRCVHRGLLAPGAMSLTWADEGSGAWEDAGLWGCEVGEAGGASARSFVARRHHDDPGYPKCWVFAR